MSNFRSLRAVEVRLAALNVLVGPNGAGKSNLLDVIAFLGDATREDLGPALERRGGFDRVLFRGGGDQRPSSTIEVEAAVTKNSNLRATDNYQLGVSRGKLRGQTDRYYLLRSETFAFKRTAGPGRRIAVSGN